MKKIFIILFLILVFPLKVNAYNLGEAAILMEEDTKRVLVSKNMNKKMLIASTTKIMTAIVVLENVNNMQETAIISNKAAGVGGSRLRTTYRR